MNIQLIEVKKCPACGSTRRQPMLNLDQFDLIRCQCGHRYIDPALHPASQVAIYQSSETLCKINPALHHYYEYDLLDPGSQTYRNYLLMLEEVKKVQSGKRLLEVGCGSGSFLKLAHQLGWEVTGIDSSRANIESVTAAAIRGIETSFLDYTSDGSFDCIFMLDLIEHFPTPSAFLKKSSELLVKGGVLFLATPCYPNLLSAISEFLYFTSLGSLRGPAKKLYLLEHTSYFNRLSLTRLLKDNNFHVLKFWKSETDLKRYRFPLPTVVLLSGLFKVARMLGCQNRMNVIAQKKI